MEIRKTRLTDISAALEIYAAARKFMAEKGNPDQWTDGYPSEDFIKEDILNGNSYVITDKDDNIFGIFTFIIGKDPTYAVIENGDWLNEKPYGVIHRIASTGQLKGITDICLDWCFQQIDNIRIDTHQDNEPMKQTLIRNGFKYCGIIFCHNGTERIAFQKYIGKK